MLCEITFAHNCSILWPIDRKNATIAMWRILIDNPGFKPNKLIIHHIEHLIILPLKQIEVLIFVNPEAIHQKDALILQKTLTIATNWVLIIYGIVSFLSVKYIFCSMFFYLSLVDAICIINQTNSNSHNHYFLNISIIFNKKFKWKFPFLLPKE